ncbi:MAG: DNA polymerase III subunit delta [Planctomycetes bacterium]|nr:DNA polymerase III subunit delta [Planctomycetota bacterium]
MAESKQKSRKIAECIYVISGKQRDLVNAQCGKLIDSLLEPEQRAMGLFNVDLGEVSISQVFDELRTLPFLTDRRVVLVKDADKFVSENRELLERYFDNPSDTGTLVLAVGSWPARTKLAKKLGEVGKLISVEQPKPWQLPSRLRQYATEGHGKNLSEDAARYLVEITGDNLSQLYNEIDKLALFAESEKTITVKHIEALTGNNRMFNVFAVIDSIVEGRVAKAVERLRKMFDEDKSAEFTVVGAFAFHFRRLFNAKAMLDKGARPAEVISKLRIWGNKEGFLNQVRKMSLRQIGDNIQKLAITDYQIKTGQAKSKVAIEQLVFRLAAR